MNRRGFLIHTVAAAGLATAHRRHRVWAQGTAPAVVTPDRLRPQIPCGVQSGDITRIAPSCGARAIGRRA